MTTEVPADEAPAAEAPDPELSPADEASVDEVPSHEVPAAVRWRRRLAWGAIGALLLGGGGFLYAGVEARDAPAAANRALTDSAATDAVIAEVGSALAKVLSYSTGDTAATAQAARALLDGPAATQYQQLFAQVQQRAPEQQLILSTRVVRVGVVQLEGDQAQLLVFLDQTAQRKERQATMVAAQLSVTAHRKDGHWRITELKSR
ncbi:nuclear transport factor 2 family protein [Saccharothrix sp. ST-888]|uniref:nuclear transport factor 2 family protein n=1 Tax=Saccharothrix sp. ST-888 TaxID=1427391 RepID=UPI0006980092|nr:nuclear transport factor 2 family protein [Saccharothrix sp. ST-888]